jgi:hypothetical protein
MPSFESPAPPAYAGRSVAGRRRRSVGPFFPAALVSAGFSTNGGHEFQRTDSIAVERLSHCGHDAGKQCGAGKFIRTIILGAAHIQQLLKLGE